MRRLLVRPWPSVNPDHAKPTSLVPAHMTLVKFIAQRMQARLPPNVEVDDLIQWGTLGLLDAIRKFDPERDNKFKTYAEFRIRGAMLDGLRAIDQTPRTVRALGRKIELTSRELQGELGRAPRPDEISIRLGISVEKFHEAQLDAMPRKEYSIEEKDCFTQIPPPRIYSATFSFLRQSSFGCYQSLPPPTTSYHSWITEKSSRAHRRSSHPSPSL